MKNMLILLVLLGFLAAPLSAQEGSRDAAMEYCVAQERSCMQPCCEKFGEPYHWSGAEQACVGEITMTREELFSMAMQRCPECAERLISCTDEYESGEIPLGGIQPGCCAGFILPLAIGTALFLRK